MMSELFWAVARELDAHVHHAPALEMAQGGADHAQDHISADEATEWQRIRCAQMQAMLGQLEKADRILLALNEEIPDDDDIVGWLGIIAAAKGDLPRAMACSTQLREMEKPPALAGWIGFYRASISAHLRCAGRSGFRCMLPRRRMKNCETDNAIHRLCVSFPRRRRLGA